MKKQPAFFRIDDNVFFLMAGLCLAALILIGFKYASYKPCLPIQISYLDSPVVEQTIRFRADIPEGKKYAWEFGDGGYQVVEHNNMVTHKYTAPGYYMVSVRVDGRCEQLADIHVDVPKVFINETLYPQLLAPDTAYVGVRAQFSDMAPTSEKWQWYFGETGMVDDTRRDPDYVFSTPGMKRIRLVVNDRPELSVSKEIFVVEKSRQTVQPRTPGQRRQQPVVILPPKPSADKLKEQVDQAARDIAETSVKKALDISHTQFSTKLVALAKGEKDLKDFAEYLCDDLNIPVVYNSRSSTFRQAANDIKGMSARRIREINVTITKDETTNCIKALNIVVKRKVFPF